MQSRHTRKYTLSQFDKNKKESPLPKVAETTPTKVLFVRGAVCASRDGGGWCGWPSPRRSMPRFQKLWKQVPGCLDKALLFAQRGGRGGCPKAAMQKAIVQNCYVFLMLWIVTKLHRLFFRVHGTARSAARRTSSGPPSKLSCTPCLIISLSSSRGIQLLWCAFSPLSIAAVCILFSKQSAAVCLFCVQILLMASIVFQTCLLRLIC